MESVQNLRGITSQQKCLRPRSSSIPRCLLFYAGQFFDLQSFKIAFKTKTGLINTEWRAQSARIVIRQHFFPWGATFRACETEHPIAMASPICCRFPTLFSLPPAPSLVWDWTEYKRCLIWAAGRGEKLRTNWKLRNSPIPQHWRNVDPFAKVTVPQETSATIFSTRDSVKK